MTRLDVENLFTNIPLYYKLFSNNDAVHNIIKEDLKELLKFASYDSFLTFDNEYYCQLDGVTMRSQLGPTLANAFLYPFKKQCFSDSPQEFCPIIYRRYVDDIFVIFNSHEQLKKFVEYINTRHPRVKFTFEHIHNNSFSFLSITKCRENNKTTTCAYRKTPFSGVFTNFKSFMPTVSKSPPISFFLFFYKSKN